MNNYSSKRYNSFGSFLKSKFNKRIFKISVDAGFSCPNRDGSLSTDGCIYCENSSFRVKTIDMSLSLKDQIEKNINFAKNRYKTESFIVYFQNYSNTYSDINNLKKYYETALSFKEVIGLSIGTRTDCINEEILDYLNELGEKTYLWIEYGLQSIHNETLKIINRCHDFENFLQTYNETRKRKNINICVHLIHGLPGETKKMMMKTVKTVSDINVDGIKLHQLHVVKGTKLEEMYNNGDVTLPTLEEYLDLTASSLEILSPKILIHRLFGLSNTNVLVAPKWGIKKHEFIKIIDNYLEEKDSYQGKCYRS